mmetsp:Transcript_22089/g.28188  ORF Transcript_22089/g.28188 Transcript_22089/m.28188 type:complete len:242 (-) Transcript_22089:222-947(-)
MSLYHTLYYHMPSEVVFFQMSPSLLQHLDIHSTVPIQHPAVLCNNTLSGEVVLSCFFPLQHLARHLIIQTPRYMISIYINMLREVVYIHQVLYNPQLFALQHQDKPLTLQTLHPMELCNNMPNEVVSIHCQLSPLQLQAMHSIMPTPYSMIIYNNTLCEEVPILGCFSPLRHQGKHSKVQTPHLMGLYKNMLCEAVYYQSCLFVLQHQEEKLATMQTLHLWMIFYHMLCEVASSHYCLFLV